MRSAGGTREAHGERHGKRHGVPAYESACLDATGKRTASRLTSCSDNASRGHDRSSPAAPHRDDRSRQLVARPAGGARARREQGRRRARHRRVLRLPLRRARRRARPARDVRHARRGADADAADAAGRGDHRGCRGGARAGDDRRAGAPRPALQAVPEPAGGRVRVDPRGARSWRGTRSRARSTSARASRARSPTRRSSCSSRSPRRSRRRSSTRSSTSGRSGVSPSSRRSRGSPRRSPSRSTSRSRSRRS